MTATTPALVEQAPPAPTHRRRRRTAGSVVGEILRYLALVVSAVLFLLPFYLIIRNALASDVEITAATWTFFPSTIHWENFAQLFNDPAVTFIPSFIIVSQLRWVDTLQGIIVPVLFSGFTTFLFRQYFLAFPRSLEEAARVDGLGYFGAFWRVVVPNSGAFFAAIAVITFIASWNAFLWPLVIGQDSSMWTVQVALSTFLTAQTINLHELFLAAAVSIAPLVLVFVFLQRYLVQGVAETGIKG